MYKLYLSNGSYPVGVFGVVAMDNTKVDVLQLLGNWTDLAVSHFFLVNFDNRGDSGAGAGEKNFISTGQFCGHDFPLNGGYVQLFAGQFNDGISGDAFQNILIKGGGV